MNIEKSLSDKLWEENQIDFKHIQALSQKKSISNDKTLKTTKNIH